MKLRAAADKFANPSPAKSRKSICHLNRDRLVDVDSSANLPNYLKKASMATMAGSMKAVVVADASSGSVTTGVQHHVIDEEKSTTTGAAASRGDADSANAAAKTDAESASASAVVAAAATALGYDNYDYEDEDSCGGGDADGDHRFNPFRRTGCLFGSLGYLE